MTANDRSTDQSGPGTSPFSTSPDAPLVLVAEDEDGVRQMVALALRSIGYRAELYADGADAAAAFDAGTRPDVVLLDVRMPRMSGVELVRYLRAHPDGADLPVVAMSAYSDELQAREMAEAGATAFLAKPFTLDELRATMLAIRGS
jgi:CheY-like chemotaxis protein